MTALAVTGPSVQTHKGINNCPLTGPKTAREERKYILLASTLRGYQNLMCMCVCVWSRAGGQSPQRAADETMCVTESRPIHTLTVGVLLTTDFIMAINRPYEWR